jgi:hypothetical protein
MVVHAYNPSCWGFLEAENQSSRNSKYKANRGKKLVKSHLNSITGGVAQGVECLPSKHEALSSNSSTTHTQNNV